MDRPRDPTRPPGRPPSWWRAHLVAVAVAGAACLAFAALAEEIGEEETLAFDRAVLLSLRAAGDPSDPLGPRWLEEVGRDVTALGSVAVIALFSVAATGYLWLARRRRAAWILAGSIVSGEIVVTALKLAFDRPRPDVVAHHAAVYTASFPSGHSMLSAVAFLTAGALLARAESRRRVKAYLWAWALLLTALTGASRVYLGVHWPTDVAAGWLAGAGWAAICWAAAGLLERRRWSAREAAAGAAPITP